MGVILADGQVMVRQGLAALFGAESDVALLGEAADGEAAWGLVQTCRPHVVILDFDIPKGNGIEFARRIESETLDTRVLLLSTHEDAAAAFAAQEAGVAGYVLKHSPFEELMLALGTVAAGGTFMTPRLYAKLRAIRRDGLRTMALSTREREVVRLIAEGKRSKEIARILAISPGTVETHRKRLMRKLGLHSATEVVRWGVRWGMVA